MIKVAIPSILIGFTISFVALRKKSLGTRINGGIGFSIILLGVLFIALVAGGDH